MADLDILFINPGNREKVFQKLGKNLTSIEPPFQIASYANFLRGSEGRAVGIVDANALALSHKEVVEEVERANPRLVSIIVYGNQPSASTQNMDIAIQTAKAIKSFLPELPVSLGGLHASAIPERTLLESEVDFVIEGEEQIPLAKYLDYLDKKLSLSEVPGIWYQDSGMAHHNEKPALITDLDHYLPAAAWDLLPMEVYRAHNWHCLGHLNKREPYAAIYTSLGCPYKCDFCCINASFGTNRIRFRSPDKVVEELEFLNKGFGVVNVKIIDEMFILNERHYMSIVEGIIEKGLNLNIWAYARIDSIKESNLEKMKEAGINWIGVGIESGDEKIRDISVKGLKNNSVLDVVRSIEASGINVASNFIFGLPNDSEKSMRRTFTLALELNTAWVNLYCAMAYPGSPLYKRAVDQGKALPETWTDFSQHSFGTLPLGTDSLSPAEVLEFRDRAFHEYFSSFRYLDKIKNVFGEEAVVHINGFNSIRLPRKLYPI